MPNDPITVKKLSANVDLRSDGCILLRNVRLSYPHLFKAWAKNPEKEKAKFSARFLIDKTTHDADIKALKKHIAGLMEEHFKGKIPSDKLFFRDGEGSAKPEQENAWSVSASEDRRPDVINRDKSRVNEEDDIVYAGCYVNALIRPWAQKNIHGKRLNANLLAVQFVKDGARFGADRPSADEAFGEVTEDFDDGDDDGDDDKW
ncbi:MAG: hypothetical protein DDT26_00278 [Dehalococcoidia bacterium]|nr:hypothetical protein [Chloroflexota bacterium]